MLTAEQIATTLDLPNHTVRYRLGILRGENSIKYEQLGMTYGYAESVVKKVKDFEERDNET